MGALTDHRGSVYRIWRRGFCSKPLLPSTVASADRLVAWFVGGDGMEAPYLVDGSRQMDRKHENEGGT